MMLVVEDIDTYYGKSHVLQGVSLKIMENEIVALLGRNGAGKSTLVKSIIGRQPASNGDIFFRGNNINNLASHRIARLGISVLNQGRSIFPTLTALENIMIGYKNRHNQQWDLDKILGIFPALAGRLSHWGWQLSGGEQQMVVIARALMTNPKMLVLDEPSEGLAPLILSEIGKTIRLMCQLGVSVMLVEQNVPFALQLADRVYVMNKGRISFDGHANILKENNTLLHRYLGM